MVASYVLYGNCMKTARLEAKRGHYDYAGQLCCLLGDLLEVSYRRMTSWQSPVNIAALIMDLYVHGRRVAPSVETGHNRLSTRSRRRGR